MNKLLADENIPPGVVRFLRDRGFDVKEVGGEGTAGASDDQVMELASKEHRVLLTFDKHFANILVYPPGSGLVVLARMARMFKACGLAFFSKQIMGPNPPEFQ